MCIVRGSGGFKHRITARRRAAVDEARNLVSGVRKDYGIKQITGPVFQPGTYSFYMVDMDESQGRLQLRVRAERNQRRLARTQAGSHPRRPGQAPDNAKEIERSRVRKLNPA